MYKVVFINTNKEIRVRKSGESILSLAIKSRVPLRHKCGGKGSCGTCKVQIEDQEHVTPPSSIEKKLISHHQLAQGYRLGCQTKIKGDVMIHIPEDPLKARIRALLAEEQANKSEEI